MSEEENESLLWDEDNALAPRSIFDCQYISKDQANNTWHCSHCGKTYAVIHATKAVKHLAAIPGVNKGYPRCKQTNRLCPITTEMQRLYNHFHNNIEKKQVAHATGKRRTTESLDQSLSTATATYATYAVGRGKKARGVNLKSPPSASSVSTSSFKRAGAVAPRMLGAPASGHFKTASNGPRKVQLKMTDLSPNPSAEQELTVAIAQLIHCAGLPFSLASSELFRRIITLAKAVPTSYRPPSRNQVAGPLLRLLYDELQSMQLEDLWKDDELFKHGYYLDGATIKTVPFLNVMASGPYNHKAVMDIIDCTDHMAEGGMKDATYVADKMKPTIEKVGSRNAVLFAFDGAYNVQKAGAMLEVSYPWATTIHAAEHVVALMFKYWFMTMELELLTAALGKIVGSFGGSKHVLGALLKKHSKNHHNGRFVGLLHAVDTRMAGYAISFLRLLRLRPVIEAMMADPVYKTAKPATALTELLKNGAFWHVLYVICRATFGALRLLRLCDMQVAAMDKLYYYVLKCRDQFQEPGRIAELNSAAWNANTHTTEMYKWIHMYFCDGQKKAVPFDSQQASPSEQVRVLTEVTSDDDDDSNADDDEDAQMEENVVPVERLNDILACRTSKEYTLSERFEMVYDHHSRHLIHPFSISAWICSPVPQVQATWYKIDEADKGVLNSLLIKLYVDPGLTLAQFEKESDELILKFWDEWHFFSSRTGPFEAKYKWASADITENRSHFWHKKHSTHCTTIFGRFSCVVTSMIAGIGNAERQWRDVKTLKNGQRSHLSSSAVRMQATLYGDHCSRQAVVRRDRILEANGRSEKGMCIWEDQDLETCGLDAYGIDIRAEIAATKPAAKRQFKLWEEPWEIMHRQTKDPVILQKFVHKYRDIGWYDLDNGVMFTHHPSEVAWASAKPAGIAAFGLKEGFDMDRDLEEQPEEYEIWIMNDDFYHCVAEFDRRHPNDKIDFIRKEDFFKKPDANDLDSDDSSSGSSTALSPTKKTPPRGMPKRTDSDSDESDDEDEAPQPSPGGKAKKAPFGNDSDDESEEDSGRIVTIDEMRMASPSEEGKPRWGRCFRCGRGPFSALSLVVFDRKVFHSEQCLQKFKADIAYPTPGGADLTGIADHAATPVTKPTALDFESPTRAAAASRAAADDGDSETKSPVKETVAAKKKQPAKKAPKKAAAGASTRPRRAGKK